MKLRKEFKNAMSAGILSWLTQTDRVEYRVVAKDFQGGEYSLSFTSRENARIYKRCLMKSTSGIEAHIQKHQWHDGMVQPTEKVS